MILEKQYSSQHTLEVTWLWKKGTDTLYTASGNEEETSYHLQHTYCKLRSYVRLTHLLFYGW